MSGRFNYVKYDEKSMELQAKFKTKFEELEALGGELKPGRASQIFFTKIEEAYAWVGKSIRDEQIFRNGSAPLQEQRINS